MNDFIELMCVTDDIVLLRVSDIKNVSEHTFNKDSYYDKIRGCQVKTADTTWNVKTPIKEVHDKIKRAYNAM